ncbi:sulfotransferase domain-containing protein [Fodinibius salsisoli]|uniref:Sulfotransferase n=1 Tax=Fodinibius salsisoli TaxID=2820877 RepID=A0ABT3PTM1_9BACT|nr:sulfotransferase domain-containing protein [Fodinibius salsisoli]MCW9709184.1 sulfotransferase [Fodinibius salsisoli]
MSFKQQSLRRIRNFLYRHLRSTLRRFEQANRALLRSVDEHPSPIAEAPQITNRQTDDRWQSIQPVWVLSTGRTGTNTMTELFKLSPLIDAFHEPAPELFQFSYDYFMNQIDRSDAKQMLKYLRDELVFRSYRDGFIFVETNNRLAYIADLLLDLYPSSKFIHVYRNPYDFIRSGMRRSYYQGHMRDYARIHPIQSEPDHEQWKTYTAIQKTAWNWKRVNEYCLNFMATLPQEQKMSFSSEDFFEADPSLTDPLFNFIGSSDFHPPVSDINRVMGKKHNAQKRGQFSKPSNWTDQQVEQVNAIIAPVAATLEYPLISDESIS